MKRLFRFLPMLPVMWLCLTGRGQDLPQAWEHRAGLAVDSCPAIATNGVVYVTSSGSGNFADPAGGHLFAFDTNGAQNWAFSTPEDIHSSPAVGADGTIYFGCRDRKLYAVTHAGAERWHFLTGAWVDSSAGIATDGTIYFGSWDGKFYALNPEGRKKWEFKTGGPIDSSPAIALDRTIYFGSHDGKFYALNPDGRKKWEFVTKGAIISSPAITAEGLIYFTSVDGRFYALNSDGTEKWHVWTGGVRGASPVIDPQGNIYLGVNDLFEVLKPDGTKKWDFGFPTVNGAAAIAADGTVYFAGYGDDGEELFGFNAAGLRQSTTVIGDNADSSPAIGSGGVIYAGGAGGGFHAFRGGSALANSAWPKFRGDALQTGRAHAP